MLSQTYIGLHAKHPVLISDLNGTSVLLNRFSKKWSDITFCEIPSSLSRGIPCGRMDGQTDMTKLIIAFRNFVNAPKNRVSTSQQLPLKPVFDLMDIRDSS